MKKLLFISLIFLSANAFSQIDSLNTNIDINTNINININSNTNSNKHKKRDDLKIIGVYAASIILNGIGDGLNNSNHKTAGHAINALSIGMLVASPFLLDYDKKKWYWYLASYTSLRIGLFDWSYNLTRELPFGFTGTTAPTDKFYKILKINPNIPRPLLLGLGIVIPLTEL